MPCPHVWINRRDPLRRWRQVYRAVIGSAVDEMKLGEVYHCRECDAVLPIGAMALFMLPIADSDQLHVEPYTEGT
jgi:hypothetical protein